jgi:hypothetical protein
MSFKINLKPYPAAEYFTVREHLRRDTGLTADFAKLKEQVAERFRFLFDVPRNYFFYAFRALYSDVLASANLVVKDDPVTGIDVLRKELVISRGAIIDLSYSFPQTPSNYADIPAVLINPAVSLGIPGDMVFLFSERALPASWTEKEVTLTDDQALLLLELVLTDYFEKGRDVLMRESNYKAAVLNQLIDVCSFFKPIAEKQIRSKTVILMESDPDILPQIKKMGYEVGRSDESGKTILAIANYPTHSKELVEMFADRISAL